MFAGLDDSVFIERGGREWVRAYQGPAFMSAAASARTAANVLAHPHRQTLAPVVPLFLTFFCRLLLLLKGGVVGGDELVLVRALVVMVA